jgi:hypothetical protein
MWVVFLSRYGVSLVFEVLPKIYFLVAVISLIAFVQYFISPTLWGLLDYSSSNLEWASSLSFEKYSVFFRASSLAGSPQVLSLLCALIFALVIVDVNVSKGARLIYAPLILGAGIITGSKAAIVLVAIGVGWLAVSIFAVRRRKRAALTLAGIIAFSVVMFFIYFEEIVAVAPVVDRVLDLQAALEQESRDSRVDRLIQIFSNTNPLIGYGYTTSLFTDVTGYRAAESYIGKLYFHFGIFPVAALLVLLGSAFFVRQHIQKDLVRLTVVMVFTSMWVSTAFEATLLFPIWGILVAGCMSLWRDTRYEPKDCFIVPVRVGQPRWEEGRPR